MFKKAIIGLFSLLLIFIGIGIRIERGEATDNAIQSDDIWWQTQVDFARGVHQGTSFQNIEGLHLLTPTLQGVYESSPIAGNIPFNVLFTQWQQSATGVVQLQIRTRSHAGNWSEWHIITPNDDFTPTNAPFKVGSLVTVPLQDQTHTHFQFRVSLKADDAGNLPNLAWLHFTLVDSTAGINDADLLPSSSHLSTFSTPEDIYPKPPVVSRDEWCQDTATLSCTYSIGSLSYEPVTHLVLHHTATSSAESDWASVVRAIWFFHGAQNGWGDIGYHYLVAPNGLIFEGHLGGDDVVGVHAGDANYGTMGVAMLGNYSDEDPTPELLDSVADLLAWKADQKNIDVLDSSPLSSYDYDYGFPHLIGHRDVYGGPPQTYCPGDQGHYWLPWLKQEIIDRIDFSTPYLYFEEWWDGADTNLFTASEAYWYEANGGCGNQGHAYYTYSTTSPELSTDWANYRPELPATGVYEVQVYTPYCATDIDETTGATYEVNHLAGIDRIVIDQEANLGSWVTLGEFPFLAGNNGSIFLSDLTTTDNGNIVWFDALRYRYISPTITLQRPVGSYWHNMNPINFTWELSDLLQTQTTTLQIATNINMTNLIVEETLPAITTTYSHTFDQSYNALYWRILVTNDITTTASNTVPFGVDISPPTAHLNTLMQIGETQYALYGEGEEVGSGIDYYELFYQVDGESEWHLCQTTVIATGICTVPSVEEPYWFGIRAWDIAGNASLLAADIHTSQAIQPVVSNFLPLIFNPE